MKPRPVLRYHGGKWKLAPWIIDNMPPHRIYVEPFGGGASVLLRKPRSYAKVYNDQWGLVVNVFAVLRDETKALRLKRAIELTPYARDEFDKCGDIDIASVVDCVERARRTIARSFMGFGSASTNARHSTGFRGNSNRSGTTPAHDWVNYPNHIPAFVERMRGVVIENRSAASVMSAHDSDKTLHYVDPPYMHSTRNMQRGNAAYAVEMSEGDHEGLAAQLNGLRGMVMLSGYPSDRYACWYREWMMLKRDSFADGARRRTECLWLNKKCFDNLPQLLMSPAQEVTA